MSIFDKDMKTELESADIIRTAEAEKRILKHRHTSTQFKLVFIGIIAFGAWHGMSAYQKAEVARIQQDKENEAREKVGKINGLLKEGKFWDATGLLPDYTFPEDPLNKYLPENKRKELQAIRGIALWSMLEKPHNDLTAHTFNVDFFKFMRQFTRTDEVELTEQQKKLKEFGQLEVKGPERVFDVEAMQNWFKVRTGVDVQQDQFLIDDKLELKRPDYDIDKEKWLVKEDHFLIPSRFNATEIRSGESYIGQNAFGMQKVIERETIDPNAFLVANFREIKEKLGSPIVIPMKYDDAKCDIMHVFYKVYPLSNKIESDMGYAAEKKATMLSPKEVTTYSFTGIPIRINEIRIYCEDNKKMLWSDTF